MEEPLHTVRRAAFSAMLDGRDWLAEEWRTLYLPPLAAADASSIAYFFLSPPHPPTLHLRMADLHVDEVARERGTESKR